MSKKKGRKELQRRWDALGKIVQEWNLAKTPCDPKFRKDMAREYRRHRRVIFERFEGEQRKTELAALRELHRSLLRPAIEAEIPLREFITDLRREYQEWLEFRHMPPAGGVQ